MLFGFDGHSLNLVYDFLRLVTEFICIWNLAYEEHLVQFQSAVTAHKIERSEAQAASAAATAVQEKENAEFKIIDLHTEKNVLGEGNG